MKKFYFEKRELENGEVEILATYGGWSNSYTADGEVDTSIEYIIGEEITQEEAEKYLNEYGWIICGTCGNIYANGGECDDCQNMSWQNIEYLKEYIKRNIEEKGFENNQIELEFCNLGEEVEIRIAAQQLGYEIEAGEGQGMYWIYKPI